MNLAEQVKARFPNIVVEAFVNHKDPAIVIRKDGIKNLAANLKKDSDFNFNVLMDMTCVDYLFWEEKENRFEVVYNLFSTTKNHRLFIKAPVSEQDPVIDSLVSIWPAANWYEREIWDMFGVKFSGHPSLKRILMYEEFQGHPLRKDYVYNQRQPLIGPKN